MTTETEREGDFDPMPVTFIDNAFGGRRPEPPLDQSWDKLTQLRWKAGCVLAETGVTVRIGTDCLWRKSWFGFGPHRPVRDVFSLNIGNGSHMAYDLEESWTFLNGVAAGAEAAGAPS